MVVEAGWERSSDDFARACAATVEERCPELELPHLIGYLFEVGPVTHSEMGSAKLSHLEIDAWMRLRGVPCTPWEVLMLRRLSTEYLNETHRAKKADAPAPWSPPEQEPLDREAIANHLDSIFGAYK